MKRSITIQNAGKQTYNQQGWRHYFLMCCCCLGILLMAACTGSGTSQGSGGGKKTSQNDDKDKRNKQADGKMSVEEKRALIEEMEADKKKQQIGVGQQDFIDFSSDRVSTVIRNNAFAFELYKKVSTTEQNKNFFFCNYAVSATLAAIYEGATGETKKKMKEVLHFHPNTDQVRFDFKAINERLIGQRVDSLGLPYTFKIVNGFWGKSGFNFDRNFMNYNSEYYNVALNKADFYNKPGTTRKIINNWWTSNSLQDALITSQVVPKTTKALLISSLVHEPTFDVGFGTNDLRKDDFWVNGKQLKQNVDFLTKRNVPTRYFRNGETEILELFYTDKKQSVLIVAPAKGQDLAEIEKRLSIGQYQWWMDGLSPSVVKKIALPQFTIENQVDIQNELTELGLDMFDKTASFDALTDDKELYINQLTHRASIALAAEAEQAYPNIAGEFKNEAGYYDISIKIDRPFLFIIQDKRNDSIIGMGRVTNPLTK